MRTFTLLSLAAVFMPFIVSGEKILPYFVEVSGRTIYQGYWQNWCDLNNIDGAATPACMQLNEVPDFYNVVAVAFMKSDAEGDIPTFAPEPLTGMNDENFPVQVLEIAERNATVILSLGGPDSNLLLDFTQVDAFVNEILRLGQTYGFSGVDVNLERSVMENAETARTVVTALMGVKRYYERTTRRKRGIRRQYFYTTLALQISFACNNTYKDNYLEPLVDFIDFMTVKFYDFDDIDLQWLVEIDYQAFEASSDKMVQVYAHLENCHDLLNLKFMHGTPVNRPVGTPSDMYNIVHMFHRLYDQKKALRGITAWSINSDYGSYFNGTKIGSTAPQLFSEINQLYKGGVQPVYLYTGIMT